VNVIDRIAHINNHIMSKQQTKQTTSSKQQTLLLHDGQKSRNEMSKSRRLWGLTKESVDVIDGTTLKKGVKERNARSSKL
jgi:hypothetical protein